MKSQTNIGTYWKFLLGWPLSIIALFFIFKIIAPNLKQIPQYLTGIHIPFLILGFVCFLIYYLVRSFFWRELLKEKGHTIRLKETAYLWSMSEVKRFIPGNIWGFFGRTAAFSQKEIKKSTVISSIIIESEFVVLSSFVLSFFAFSFLLFHIFSSLPHKNIVLYAFPGIVFIFLIVFLNSHKFFKKFPLPSFIQHILPSFSFSTNIFLFLLSCIYTFFFGLGTYFCIYSIFFLNPQNSLLFIGVCIFSYFIGYISFITPMGLGVREGMLTATLSQFISLGAAGFAAIFARIMLIIAELVFLLFAIIWYHSTI